MKTLTAAEYSQVTSQRKVPRPVCFDPQSTVPVPIGLDMEAFLALASDETKKTASQWVTEILNQEADAEYEALMTELADVEDKSISTRLEYLNEKTLKYETWRQGSNIRGFEDVAEIGWLYSELQSGYKPYAESDRYKHDLRLLRAAKERLSITKDTQAKRKDRINAWSSVLASY
jgi:hypothetical protein